MVHEIRIRDIEQRLQNALNEIPEGARWRVAYLRTTLDKAMEIVGELEAAMEADRAEGEQYQSGAYVAAWG